MSILNFRSRAADLGFSGHRLLTSAFRVLTHSARRRRLARAVNDARSGLALATRRPQADGTESGPTGNDENQRFYRWRVIEPEESGTGGASSSVTGRDRQIYPQSEWSVQVQRS